jgi:hypothetical protein
MIKEKPLYLIGDLFVEFIDGINMSTGIVTNIKYDSLDKEYIYSIMWNDMALETEIFESIAKWRVENGIFIYYKVVK